MKKIYEITDIASGVAYIKETVPLIYEDIPDAISTIEKRVAEMFEESETDNYRCIADSKEEAAKILADIKIKMLIDTKVTEAFEVSGKDAAITEIHHNDLWLNKYLTNETHIILDGKYKFINDFCFEYCKNLKSVILSEGIIRICEGAFSKTESLVEVKFPSSLQHIGIGAFRNCHNLRTVYFSNDRTNINPTAFEGTAWMQQFDKDFVIVNSQLLKYQGNAENVIIPEGVIDISHNAFEDNNTLRAVVFPSTLKTVGVYSFANCTNLSEVTMNDNFESVGICAFEDCDNLTEIELPASLKEICASAFSRKTILRYNGTAPEVIEYIKAHHPNPDF